MGSETGGTPGSHIENEIKLSVPQRFRLPDLTGAGTILSRRVGRSVTTFFDTPDLVLAGWGCLLRYRTQEGWTVKLPDAGRGAARERPEQTFDAPRGAPPPAAVDLLGAVLRGRELVPVATIHTIRRRLAIGDDETERVVLVDDLVRTGDGQRRMRELEVELIDENALALRDKVARLLVDAGATAVDTRTKYSWALGDRRPIQDVPVPEIGTGSLTSDVVRAALAASVRDLLVYETRIRADLDAEAVHQARIAVRRLRSDLRAFKPLLDAQWADDLRGELGTLGALLGQARDRGVLMDRLRSDGTKVEGDLGPALAALGAELGSARAELHAAIRTKAHMSLLDRLVDAARAPSFSGPDGPAAQLLRPSVVRGWRRLRRARRRARTEGSIEDLHRVRIEAKRLRYTSEALAPVFGKRAARLADAANALQDVLGEHQDAVVAGDWLRSHSTANGASTAFALGELATIQAIARDEARERWPDAWQSLRRWRPSKWR